VQLPEMDAGEGQELDAQEDPLSPEGGTALESSQIH
jgi:hypothetical protein